MSDSEPPHYSLQVVRVTDVQRRSRGSRLYVEVSLDDTPLKTGDIGDDGQPGWRATFTFSQLDESAVFRICLRDAGNGKFRDSAADVEVSRLFESNELDVQLTSKSSKIRRVIKRKSVSAATVHVSFKKIDALTRSDIDIEAAKQSVERIKTLSEKSDSSVTAIGSVIKAMDVIVGVADKVADIHPVISVSWKAVSVVYKVVSGQFENDKILVELVDKMKTAHDFSRVADRLNDKTELLKPIVKQLLEVTMSCSRFVQDYARHSFTGRAIRVLRREDICEFITRFDDLRGKVDSVIALNTADVVQDIQQQQRIDSQVAAETKKGVIDIGLEQQLNALKERLGLSNPDPVDVSTRPRCLKGTREEYLDPIMEFLSSETTPNVLWLTGAAGSGKSTIAVTASDRCGEKGEKGCEAAHLFFQRERGEYSTVIRAIAYKLAVLHSSIAKEIIGVMERNRNVIDLPLRNQFERVLLEPLQATVGGISTPIAVILDALDECGSSEQRRGLLSLLEDDFARLPSKVRVLITSREEDDIVKSLSKKSHIRHISVDHTSEESQRDVGQHIRMAMGTVFGEYAAKDEEWDVKMQNLSDAAGGLFIWGSTAVKMVQSSDDTEEELETLLEDIGSIGGHGIDHLYATALKGSGISWDRARSKDRFISVLGLVLFAKEALCGEGIEAFLGLGKGKVELTLGRLRSVLSFGPGQAVRLHHASFADYLLSDKRSGGQPWHVDEVTQRVAVTNRCLDQMRATLGFNMCDVESSFVFNKDVPGLQDRIKERIPWNLDYACRFWSSHTCDLPNSAKYSTKLTPLNDKIKEFMNTGLLYWLEVLSLTGHFNRIAIRALFEVSLWTAALDGDLSSLLWAAYRFASVFAYPISQSVAQIYLSGLSFWKGESRVVDHYSAMYPYSSAIRYGSKPPAQCIKVIKGHADLVTSVAFSPDGKRVVSGSWDKTVRIWDSDSGNLVLRPFEGHTFSVRSVAFSPDGKRVVSGSDDGTVRIWDADSGNLVSGPFEGHLFSVRSVAFSPDGKRVVSADDGTVRIWDADSGNLVSGPFKGHTRSVTSVAFSPDGKRVVSGSGDKTVRIWDADSGNLVSGPFKGHTESVRSVAFSPDGKHVVSGSDDESVRMWDADSGKLVSRPFEGHTGSVRSVAFSPDGKHVVSGSDDESVRMWDADGGNLVSGPFEGHTSWVTSVAFSPDGKRVVSGSWDKTVRIWDADSGNLVSGPFKGHTREAASVAFSPDGKRVVSGSDDKTVRIWDPDSGNLVSGPFKGHTREAASVAFSPDGKRVVSGSDDKTVRIWDPDSGNLVSRPFEGHTGWVTSVAFSPDGKRVVSGSWDKTVRIWDADSGNLVSRPFEGHTSWVTSVAFSPDGKRVVSGSDDKTVRIWDADSGNLVSGPFEGHTEPVTSVAFSPDGKRVVSGSHDRTVRMWDADSGNLVSGPFEGHTREVTSVAFSPDGKRVVSGSWDNTVRIWGADSGNLVSGPFEGHTDWVKSVAFSPDGKRVVSGSDDKTVRIWDADSGNLVSGPFEGHKSWVTSVAFSPDGKRVVSGSSDKTVRMWDAGNGLPVSKSYCGYFSPVKAVAFSSVGSHVLSGSDDGTTRMWDVRSEGNASGTVGISSGGAPCTTSNEPDPPPGVAKEVKVDEHENDLTSPEGRQISYWRLEDDGWVVTEKGELLTWVPEDMRRTLWGCRNTAVLNCQFSTRLDFSSAPVGVGWYKGFVPER